MTVEPDPQLEDAPPRVGRARAAAAGVGLVLAFVFTQAVLGLLLTLAGVEIDLDPLTMETVFALIAIQAGSAVVGFGALAGLQLDARAAGLRADRGSGLRGWIALLPVGLVVIGPSLLVALGDGGDLVEPGLEASLAVALTLLALAIGLNEELWFRGLVLGQLHQARMPIFTISASALLFGIPHLSADPAFVLNALGVTLAVGVPFACVRLRHGSLVPLIALHALIDTWAFLQTGSIVATGDPDLREIAVGLVVPALLAAGYLVWFLRGEGASAVTS